MDWRDVSSAPASEGTGIIRLSTEGEDAMSWRFEVEDTLCAGPRGQPFLFGGSALGAAIEAMERAVGQPVIWANAQYHRFAVPGMTLTLVTEIGATGRKLTQARLVGEADGTRIISVQATLGASGDRFDGQWANAPSVPSWSQCPVVHDRRIYQTGINTHFEFRLAQGRYPDGILLDAVRGDGRVLMWVRPTGGYRIDRPMLAIIADYVSIAICDATGLEIGANSLDNTVRFTGVGHGEWVMVEIWIDTIAVGIAHGGLRIFSEQGSLLATAGTSLAVRDR